MKTAPTLRLLALVCLALGFDLATKFQARANLPMGELLPLAQDHVWLALAVNSYGALGLGSSLPSEVVKAGLIAVSLLCVFSLVRGLKHPAVQSDSARVGFALLLSAWLGNQGERLFRSDGVTDFLLVGMGTPWPASFNLADVWAIVGGALVLTNLSIYAVQHPRDLWTNPTRST